MPADDSREISYLICFFFVCLFLLLFFLYKKGSNLKLSLLQIIGGALLVNILSEIIT